VGLGQSRKKDRVGPGLEGKRPGWDQKYVGLEVGGTRTECDQDWLGPGHDRVDQFWWDQDRVGLGQGGTRAGWDQDWVGLGQGGSRTG
jgi:hypothetical protein